MTYLGKVQHGVVVLDGDVVLAEGTQVEVAVVTVSSPDSARSEGTLYDSLKDVIGIAEGLPSDAALNHDHYLYGVPKK